MTPAICVSGMQLRIIGLWLRQFAIEFRPKMIYNTGNITGNITGTIIRL